MFRVGQLQRWKFMCRFAKMVSFKGWLMVFVYTKRKFGVCAFEHGVCEQIKVSFDKME